MGENPVLRSGSASLLVYSGDEAIFLFILCCEILSVRFSYRCP